MMTATGLHVVQQCNLCNRPNASSKLCFANILGRWTQFLSQAAPLTGLVASPPLSDTMGVHRNKAPSFCQIFTMLNGQTKDFFSFPFISGDSVFIHFCIFESSAWPEMVPAPESPSWLLLLSCVGVLSSARSYISDVISL